MFLVYIGHTPKTIAFAALSALVVVRYPLDPKHTKGKSSGSWRGSKSSLKYDSCIIYSFNSQTFSTIVWLCKFHTNGQMQLLITSCAIWHYWALKELITRQDSFRYLSVHVYRICVQKKMYYMYVYMPANF